MKVALLAAYSALLADTPVAVRGRESLATSPLVAITLAAGAVAAVLVVNPGLDGEVVLSSYSVRVPRHPGHGEGTRHVESGNDQSGRAVRGTG